MFFEWNLAETIFNYFQKCHFLWQAQHFGKFGKFASGRTVIIIIANFVSKARVRRKSCSGHGRIGRALQVTRQPFSVNFFSIWDCNFSCQADYLVRLEGDSCCSAHCK